MYVKNAEGERLLVYVMTDGSVVTKNPEADTDGFDMTEVYCLGCSWHGSPAWLSGKDAWQGVLICQKSGLQVIDMSLFVAG